MDTLAKRLGYLLKEELCIYPSALSRNIGRSNNYIANVISGNNKNPAQSLFDYLKGRYNVSPVWLKQGKGDIFLDGGKQDNHSITKLSLAISELSPENRSALWEYLRLLQIREKYNQLIKEHDETSDS